VFARRSTRRSSALRATPRRRCGSQSQARALIASRAVVQLLVKTPMLGDHYIVELYLCNPKMISNETLLRGIIVRPPNRSRRLIACCPPARPPGMRALNMSAARVRLTRSSTATERS
jgi:hypothetical protein